MLRSLSIPVSRTAAVLVVLAAATGCSSEESPTTPSAALLTETFTGTLAVLGTESRNFTVVYAQGASDASITVTTLATVAGNTPVTTTIGIAFGTILADGSCLRSAVFVLPNAPLNHEQTATAAFAPGAFCAQIYDAGTLVEPVTYTMLVKHF